MSGKKKAMSGDQSKKTLKRVLSYIRPYRAAVLLSLFLALVTVVLTLYVPILTGQAVDRIVGAGAVDFAGLWGVLKRIFLVVILINNAPNGGVQKRRRKSLFKTFAKTNKNFLLLPICYLDMMERLKNRSFIDI